jgi:hypothetical protein
VLELQGVLWVVRGTEAGTTKYNREGVVSLP